MLRTVTRVLVIAAVASTGVAASMGTVQASASAPRLVATLSAPVATQPTTLIEGSGKKLKWVPKTINATSIQGTCASTNFSFLITNKTTTAQQVEYQGKPFSLAIPPMHGLYVCANGAIKGTFKLKADAKAKLTFNIT
jgi:hypothetical protein